MIAGVGALLAAAVPINLETAKTLGGRGKQIDASVENVIHGKFAANATDLYNRNFPLRQVAIDLFGTLSYLVFGEGRPGVVVGTHGWLYTSEEFETSDEALSNFARNVRYINDAVTELRGNGIRTLVAPIPAKARVYPEYLGHVRWPAEPSTRYQRFLDALRANSISHVDLLSVLASAKLREEVYLRTDTHWTPYGAQLAAAEISRAVDGENLGKPEQFSPVVSKATLYTGDLMRFIPTLDLFSAARPSPDAIAAVEARRSATNSSEELFESESLPVVLVGTSYSAKTAFGFEAQLKINLSMDVLNVAEEGKGPFIPMREFLTSLNRRPVRPKLVIWEIPERYLDDRPVEAASNPEKSK